MTKKRTNNSLVVQTEFDDWHQVLTHEEMIVIETKVRFFDWKEALIYCKARDAPMGKTKYFEILQALDKKVKNNGECHSALRHENCRFCGINFQFATKNFKKKL